MNDELNEIQQRRMTGMVAQMMIAMPIANQIALCVSLLNEVAKANVDNSALEGLVVSDDPLDNAINFLQTLRSTAPEGGMFEPLQQRPQ